MLAKAHKHNWLRQWRQVSWAARALVLGLLLAGGVALFSSSPSAAEGSPVTLCHNTGSATTPYVQITVDEDALPAHMEHGDLYPVPSGGCPAAGTPTALPTATPTELPTSTPTSTSVPTPTETMVPDPGPD